MGLTKKGRDPTPSAAGRCGARQGEKRENPHKLAPSGRVNDGKQRRNDGVGAEQESEGRDDDNERLNQQTDS